MRLLTTLLPLVFLAGCTSVPLAREEALVAPEYRLDADDTFVLALAAQPDVVITADELARCEKTLAGRIARATARTRADGQARHWQLLVQVSRYDHGDAGKRRLRAGMGGMYIDAQVILQDADGNPVASFDANRSYTWGGELGAQATIDDLELMLGDYLGRQLASKDTAPVAQSLRMAPASLKAEAEAAPEKAKAEAESEAELATTPAAGAPPATATEKGWIISPKPNNAQRNAPVR